MVEWWVAVLAAIGTAVLGYVGHYVQAKVGTQDNEDTLQDARRAEVLQHMRWAMERMVSNDQTQRRLGAGQLAAIADSPYLDAEDKRRIRAAARDALAPRMQPWETEQVLRTEEGEQA